MLLKVSMMSWQQFKDNKIKSLLVDRDFLISEIRKAIVEELGSHKTRMFSGTGATHSYNTKSGSSMLGDLDPFDVNAEELDDDPGHKIKISQAFDEDEEKINEQSDKKFKSKYSDRVNYRKSPKKYKTSRDSQGVYTVEPYKSEILPLFKFSSPQAAERSASKIYEKFINYRDKEDKVGMDISRKYLQLGYRLSKRFSIYSSGKRSQGDRSKDLEMRDAADRFKSFLLKVMKDPAYNPF